MVRTAAASTAASSVPTRLPARPSAWLPASLPVRALLAGLALLPALAFAQADELTRRYQTESIVGWRAPASAADPVKVRLIAFNDFHGNLPTRARAEGAGGPRPMGGAAVLAAYVDEARLWNPKRTLVLVAGDSIGASPPVSGVLRDEPTMEFLNLLADGDCPRLTRDWPRTPAPATTACRVVSTVGNHEFDKGADELERLLYGGKHPDGKVLGRDWKGMRIPFVASNVVRRDGQAPFLPPSVIVDLDGVKIGVIGSVTASTAALVPPQRIASLQFLPEAPPINAEVARLKAAGVHAIVLLIHEGLQTPTTPQSALLSFDETTGRLRDVLRELDPGIDVVVTGHSHRLTNVLLPARDGRPMLVTQARSGGTAYGEIELMIDRGATTNAVVAKAARILTPWADRPPGSSPARRVEKLVEKALEVTAPIEARKVGTAAAALTRAESPSGESVFGNLVADAQRAVVGTDIAFMNRDGIRADIDAGELTWGELRSAQPFGNTVMKLTLTGEQILRLLEQQWSGPHAGNPYLLRPSGLRYTYDLRRPPFQRVVDSETADGLPLDPKRRYTVAANDFIVAGGDFFSVFAEAPDATPVMLDVEALEKYVEAQGGTVKPELDGRVRRLDAPR
jgi:5'-nucleotidase